MVNHRHGYRRCRNKRV